MDAHLLSQPCRSHGVVRSLITSCPHHGKAATTGAPAWYVPVPVEPAKTLGTLSDQTDRTAACVHPPK